MVQCTEVYRACIEGRVTETARKHFNYIQGHSERCNNAVYVKMALYANSQVARETFSKLGLGTGNTSPPPSDLSTASDGHLPNLGDALQANDDVNMTLAELPNTNDGCLLDLEKELEANAEIARDTFSRLRSSSGPTDENIIERPNPNPTGIIPWPADYLTHFEDWGTAHSCAKKVATRITWDDEEKRWIMNYLDKWGAYLDPKVDKYKQLLQAIIDDPEARPIFHRNHVSAYLRLRDAVRNR